MSPVDADRLRAMSGATPGSKWGRIGHAAAAELEANRTRLAEIHRLASTEWQTPSGAADALSVIAALSEPPT